MELIPRPYGHPDVAALTAEVQAHYRALYGGPGDESTVEAADFEPPTGLGDRSGLPSLHTAEIKRMIILQGSACQRGSNLSVFPLLVS